VGNCSQLADAVSAVLDVQAQLNTTKTYTFKILLSCAAGASSSSECPTIPLQTRRPADFPGPGPTIKLTISGAPGCTKDKRPTRKGSAIGGSNVFGDASEENPRLILTLAELKMDLNQGGGLAGDNIGGFVLNNVDMANGLSYSSGACVYALNTPLTIKGGQFVGCKLPSVGAGGAVCYELNDNCSHQGALHQQHKVHQQHRGPWWCYCHVPLRATGERRGVLFPSY